MRTIDQDYVITIEQENDIIATFRNLVIKMAQAQVSNSEAQYSVFLEWCRQEKTKATLAECQLLDIFGVDAQAHAERTARDGSASILDLQRVFNW